MNDERFDFLKKDYIQGFPAYCGFEVMRVDEGIFESSLRILNRDRKVIVSESEISSLSQGKEK